MIFFSLRKEAISTNFSNQSISVNMSCDRGASGSTATRTTSAEGLIGADGGFQACLACSRMTSIVCSQCGKPFCSIECIAASEEHVNGKCNG
jgi:hypothetical protein